MTEIVKDEYLDESVSDLDIVRIREKLKRFRRTNCKNC